MDDQGRIELRARVDQLAEQINCITTLEKEMGIVAGLRERVHEMPDFDIELTRSEAWIRTSGYRTTCDSLRFHVFSSKLHAAITGIVQQHVEDYHKELQALHDDLLCETCGLALPEDDDPREPRGVRIRKKESANAK